MIWPCETVVQWNGESFKGDGPQNVSIPCNTSQEFFYVSSSASQYIQHYCMDLTHQAELPGGGSCHSLKKGASYTSHISLPASSVFPPYLSPSPSLPLFSFPVCLPLSPSLPLSDLFQLSPQHSHMATCHAVCSHCLPNGCSLSLGVLVPDAQHVRTLVLQLLHILRFTVQQTTMSADRVDYVITILDYNHFLLLFDLVPDVGQSYSKYASLNNFSMTHCLILCSYQ